MATSGASSARTACSRAVEVEPLGRIEVAEVPVQDGHLVGTMPDSGVVAREFGQRERQLDALTRRVVIGVGQVRARDRPCDGRRVDLGRRLCQAEERRLVECACLVTTRLSLAPMGALDQGRKVLGGRIERYGEREHVHHARVTAVRRS